VSLCTKYPHKIPPHKCEKRELKIKSDLKPYFEDDHLENLRTNSFRQGENDAPTEAHDEEHVNNLPKSKYVQRVFQAKWKHEEAQGLYFPNLYSKSSNFLTLVTKSMGHLILYLALLVQEVSLLVKQISSHLDVICPLTSASKVRLY